MGNIKPINIKSRTYYFYNDMISIKDFDASLLKLEKNSYKNNGIYKLDISQSKMLEIMKILIVSIHCI